MIWAWLPAQPAMATGLPVRAMASTDAFAAPRNVLLVSIV